MANEFVIKKGFHSKADSQVTGSLDVSGALTAGGSVVGSAFPFTGDAQITGSLVVSGSFASFRVDTDNVILGAGAAANIVNGAEDNVIIGTQAAGLGTITTAADKNVIIGYQAGYDLTEGQKNIFLGHQSGYNLTSGDSNIGIGEAAGFGVSSANGNINIGQNTGVNTNGSTNVSIGRYAGTGASGALPDYCVFIGRDAGRLCHDADWDIAIGDKALYNLNNGNNNIAIGRNAGYNITDSHNNIIIGSGSLGTAGMADQLRIGNGNSLITISASLATGDIIFPSTASAAYFSGDGSNLTNLPASDPFPYSGSAIISSSYTAGDTNSNVLKLIGSGSVSGSSLFEVQGAAGTLFAVNDGLDGELFAANNISGLPVISANADNSVRLGKYQGFGIFISGSTPGPTNEAAKILITGSIYNTGSVLGIHRPVATHTADFTSSIGYLGNYNIVGGNLTCSIQTSSLMPGAEFEFFQTSSVGNFLFESASNVSLIVKNDNMNLAGQGSGATLKYISGDTFHMVGDLT